MSLPGLSFTGSIFPVLGGGILGSSPETPYPSGLGGRLSRPSYQFISTAGIFFRFAHGNLRADGIGKNNELHLSSDVASTTVGSPESKNSCAVSRICAPQSPRAPIPKSNQQRHCPLI